jgi:hypothetical protein
MALEGFTAPEVIDQVRELRKEIPTTADLIAMAVKNVFDKHLSKILQLDDEYEEQPQYIIWTDRTGFTGNPTISLPDMRKHLRAHRDENIAAGLPAEPIEETDARAVRFHAAQDNSLLTWAQAHWREHWVNLSPSQIYECLHRHRPVDTTRPGGAAAQVRYAAELAALGPVVHAAAEGQAQVESTSTVEARYAIAVRYSRQFGRNPDVPPVTQDIVDTVLRANDYAPLFRPNLSAVSFHVLRLVDIRWIVERSLRNPAFAISAIHYDADVGMLLPAATNGGSDSPLVKFVFAWARENYLDRGQTLDAAISVATLSVAQAQAKIRTAQRRWWKLVERAFRVGLIDKAEYELILRAPYPANSNNEKKVAIDVSAEESKQVDLYDDAQGIAELQQWDLISTAEDQIEQDFEDSAF